MVRPGLFLDFDGTLADSIPILRRVHAQMSRDWGCHGEKVSFDRMNGLPLRRVVQMMSEHAEFNIDVEAGLRDCRERVARAYPEVRPARGAESLLRRAVDRGYRIAIVSSAPDQFIASWLQEHGLAEYIHAMIGGDSVILGKPDPEPYQLAIERTATDCASSIAVEDSELGLQSALAAGLKTYAISHGETQALEHPGIAGRLSGFADLEELLNAC
ncbi:MAG: HAD family hydrolase [Planctomycetota bacterium]|jgi:beta-phosphoglucomutase